METHGCFYPKELFCMFIQAKITFRLIILLLCYEILVKCSNALIKKLVVSYQGNVMESEGIPTT